LNHECYLCIDCATSSLALDPRLSTLGRLTYTAGYVLPGDTAGPGQTPLPSDLENAAVEQVAYWFQNRDKLGLLRYWPKDGIYQQLSGLDLLPSVAAVLERYKRWTI
jgi:hypothetical protein